MRAKELGKGASRAGILVVIIPPESLKNSKTATEKRASANFGILI